MLLYIENKAFKLRTFVVLCSAGDTVARIRAQLLHSLYEIGHSSHQFRLQYRGSYLRDAYTLEEYKILNNAVIQMIPLDDYEEWQKDKKFYQASPKEKNSNADDVVQKALKREIKHLNKREKILQNFKTFLMMQTLLAFLALLTVYWYFSFIYICVLLVAYFLIPSFTRIGGWVGKTSVRKREFMIGYGVLAILTAGAGIPLLIIPVIQLASSAYPTTECSNLYASCYEDAIGAIEEYGCRSREKQCYDTLICTAVYFSFEILTMIATSVICWVLLKNFNFNVGDIIEKYLLKTREIGQILRTANHGSKSEKRNAAFELATLASSGNDNKFEILRNEGLEILISLCLNEDSATQEYATDAIAECLTLNEIQDYFVSIGGLKTLTAVLHVKNQRTLHEAITGISYIISDSDANKIPVVADKGLVDLLNAAKCVNASGRKLLATMYLELAYFDGSRSIMVSQSATVDGILTVASRSKDEDTILISMQALELLAIESSSLITCHDKLMKYLLFLPSKILDKRVHYLITKLLIVYAENAETCEKLAWNSNSVETLLHLFHSSDSNLQKALATLALHLSEPVSPRDHLVKNGLEEFLQYIQNTSPDRQTWNIAEQTLTNLRMSKWDVQKSDLKQRSVASVSSINPRSSLHSISQQPGTSRMY